MLDTILRVVYILFHLDITRTNEWVRLITVPILLVREQKLRKVQQLVFKVSELMGNKMKIPTQALGSSAHTPSYYATWFFSGDAVSVAEERAQKLQR